MINRKLIFTGAIATIFEWYDYALFGNFAAIIGQKFFPGANPSVSMLNAFLVFAVGYLMRPIGGIFFGILGDRYGRKFSLSISVLCMSIPTGVIGLLPVYDEIGVIAPILMLLMRMIQGFSMGGALTSSISFLIEHTSKKHRGFVGSIPMASICIGILLGTLAAIITRYFTSELDFEEFGWRIPFLVGILIMFVGFYIIKYTEESPLFLEVQQSGKAEPAPLNYVIKHHFKDILISILINSTGSILFYFQATYVPNYLKTVRLFSHNIVDQISTFSLIIMAFACIFSGYISDLIGRRRTFVYILFSVILSVYILSYNLQYGNLTQVIIAQVMLGLLAAFFIGPEPALQAEFYPTNIRSTALSVSYNFSTSLFGGTTPLVVAYLYGMTGSFYGSSSYIIFASIMTMIGLYFYKDRSNDYAKK